MKFAIAALDEMLIGLDSNIKSFDECIATYKKYVEDFSRRKENSLKERLEIVEAIKKLEEENGQVS